LSAAQKQRLASLSKMRQKNYILSRSLLVHALQQQHPHLSKEWEVVDRSELPPLVLHPSVPHEVSFSISHSGKWLGLVMFDHTVQGDAYLGLDIETIKPTRGLEVTNFFCNDQQLRRLEKIQDEPELRRQITRLWTQKEAYFKANQKGVFNPQLKALSIIDAAEERSLGYLASASLDKESEISIYSNRALSIEINHVAVDQHGEFVTESITTPQWTIKGVELTGS
jgi:phosphopantetheinyl transferase